MCAQGEVCDRCGDKAVVEIHWREWAMKLCPTCAPVLIRSTEHEPVQMLPIGEPGFYQTLVKCMIGRRSLCHLGRIGDASDPALSRSRPTRRCPRSVA